MRPLCVLLLILRFVFSGFFLSVHAQTVPLSTKNGWIIVKNQQSFPVKDSFEFIETFDEMELAVAYHKNRYSIIDYNGNKLWQDTVVLTSLGYGFFSSAHSKILYRHQNEWHVLDSFDIRSYSEFWIQGQLKGNLVLINKLSKRIISGQSSSVYEMEEFLVVTHNSNIQLYNREGTWIDSCAKISTSSMEKSISYCHFFNGWRGSMVWFTPRHKFIFHRSKKLDIPKAKSVELFDEFIEIVEDRQTHFYDINKAEIILTSSGDFLRPTNENHIQFRVNGKYGLLNTSGEVCIPAQYDNIYISQHYISVRKDNLFGLYDRTFKLIFPCQYSRIVPKFMFFETQKQGYFGLVSRKNNQELLKPVYHKILVQGNKIKAWLGNQMTLLELNDEHEIVEEYVMKNVLSADHRDLIDAPLDFDPRLFDLGWFFEDKIILKPDGDEVVVLKWGLRNDNDSVFLAPTPLKLKYIHHANFTLKQVKPADPKQAILKNYQFVDWRNGKTLPNLDIHELDTNDLITKQYARFKAPDYYSGIIRSDLTHEIFPYMDFAPAQYVRYCQYAQRKLYKDWIQDTPNLELILSTAVNSRTLYKPILVNNVYYSAWQFTNAKWNYLKPDGTPLFDEPFIYAYPFKGAHAIVQHESGFGLIDTAGFVLPTEFKSITRVFINQDTFFITESKLQESSVKLFQPGKIDATPIRNYNKFKLSDKSVIFETDSGSYIIDEHDGLVYFNERKIRIAGNGYFYIKEKKNYLLHDQTGNEIGASLLRPKRVLNDDIFLAYEASKYLILNMQGLPISETKYKEVYNFENFIVGYHKTGIDIFNSIGQLIQQNVPYVNYDQMTKTLLLRFKKHLICWDENGKEIAKLRINENPVTFINGLLIMADERILDFQGNSKNIKFENYDALKIIGYGFWIAEFKGQVKQIFNESCEALDVPFEKIHYVSALSEDVIYIQAKEGVYLYQISHNKLVKIVEKHGEYCNGFLCVTVENGRYVYLNFELEMAFPMEFVKAKPFVADHAVVKLFSGWTIMNKQGELLFTPCLTEPTVYSPMHIGFASRAQVGLFDAKGNKQLPAENDLIKINKDHIRLEKMGEIVLLDFDFREVVKWPR